jgi:hypothetical protein
MIFGTVFLITLVSSGQILEETADLKLSIAFESLFEFLTAFLDSL